MSLNHHSFNLARCCMKIERYIEHRAFPQDFRLPELSGQLNHHDIWCSISTILFRSPRRSRLACRLDSNQASLGNLLRRQETSPSGSTHLLLYLHPYRAHQNCPRRHIVAIRLIACYCILLCELQYMETRGTKRRRRRGGWRLGMRDYTRGARVRMQKRCLVYLWHVACELYPRQDCLSLGRCVIFT